MHKSGGREPAVGMSNAIAIADAFVQRPASARRGCANRVCNGNAVNFGVSNWCPDRAPRGAYAPRSWLHDVRSVQDARFAMRRRSSGQERRHFRELAGFCTSLPRSELATPVRFWLGSLGFRRLCTCLLRSELATGTQGLAACRRKRRFEKSVEDCDVWAQLAPKRGRGRGGYVMPQVAGVVLAKGSAGTKVRAMCVPWVAAAILAKG
jgi:hypothetical protein